MQRRPWQFSLRTFAVAVTGVAICLCFIVQFVVQYPCRADPSGIYEGAVEAYRSGSYFDAISKCDNYLDSWPDGGDADKVRELRGQARIAAANKSSG